MLKISNKQNSILMLDNSKPADIVDAIKETVSKGDDVTVDISSMNLLDACRVSVLCSTEQYKNNPDTHINWVVSSSSVADMVSSMSLGNSSFLYD